MENENQEMVNAGNSLIKDVFEGQNQEVQPQEVQNQDQEQQQVEQQQNQEVQPQQDNQIDYQAIILQQQQEIEAMREQMEQLQQQLQPQQLQQPQQENSQLEAIKKELGLDEIERQNQQLQEKLSQQEELIHQQQIQAELARVKAELPDFNEELVSKKIFEILEQTPDDKKAAAAAFLDSPVGWRMIYEQIKLQSKPQEVKNTIVTNQSGGVAKHQKSGNEFIDIGNSILGVL